MPETLDFCRIDLAKTYDRGSSRGKCIHLKCMVENRIEGDLVAHDAVRVSIDVNNSAFGKDFVERPEGCIFDEMISAESDREFSTLKNLMKTASGFFNLL